MASPAGRSSGASCSPTNIVVDGADLKNGLLSVALKRVVPEALKPRRIVIGGVTAPTLANDSAQTAQAA